VELRCASRELPGPQHQAVGRGCGRCRKHSGVLVLGCVDEGEAEGSRTNGSTILRKETVGSRFT